MRIRGIERRAHGARLQSSEVDHYHQVLVDGDGGTLLHLSTSGSDQRQSRPKRSQVLHLDEKAAAELIGILRGTFPGIG